jgi:predicted RNA-binding Zn-ribbon protein involved in translation (DUF1610 family)
MTTDEWNEGSELVAAGTSCPMPDCGELTVAYRTADTEGGSAGEEEEAWEFTCPRCGVDFLALEEDLLFRSIRREWLWGGIHAA